MRKNPKVFFSMEYGITPFEGEVACKYGISYSSLMGKGTAQIIEDVEEKKQALSHLMKTQTGKDFTFEDKLTTVVSIIKIDVESYTAKHRPAPKK
jgi:nitroimidazol reductase NimA-like FMN-containing flavoprotein (pyridoxamine 5'-phosphate oxidase superfamily)